MERKKKRKRISSTFRKANLFIQDLFIKIGKVVLERKKTIN